MFFYVLPYDSLVFISVCCILCEISTYYDSKLHR